MKTTEKATTKTSFWLKVLCGLIAVILVSSGIAGMVHTGFGAVEIKDISYITVEGGYQRALLYIPKSATAEHPAPAIVACHGYNNTAEVQDVNSIELSRRGYVVIAPDCYRHGVSGSMDPSPKGGGVYSSLQYLGTLPFVDTENIGMVGHSMGGGNVQAAALTAFQNHEKDSTIIIPKAVLPTAQGFSMDPKTKTLPLTQYKVNLASVFGQFDEFVRNMWGTEKGSDVNMTPRAEMALGFTGAKYNSLYKFGDTKELSREEAVEAAKNLQLRGIYQPACVHPIIHFSTEAVGDIVDFFDITLREGAVTIPPSSQIWIWKHLLSGLALVCAILMTIPLGFVLLQTSFFRTICRAEPVSYSTTPDKASAKRYWIIYLLCLIPAPLLFYWCLSLANKITGPMLPMGTVNGIFILNIVTGLVSLGLFALLYQTIYKKNGASLDNMGVKLPWVQVLKSLLLSVLVFAGVYLLLEVVYFLFMVDFRFWVFSIRTMTLKRFAIMLRYLPNYLFFFAISALTLNMSTRISGKSELFNSALMFITSAVGLLVLCLLDYGVLFATGIKMIPFIGKSNTALSGILLWGVIFILPLAALISRAFFKRTGSIWTGAFINAGIVTLFAISNAVISVGVL